MGWFMQIMLNRPLPSSLVPLPPHPQSGYYERASGICHCRVHSSGVLYQDFRDTPFCWLSHHHIPQKSLKTKSCYHFSWHRKSLIPTHILLLWTWKERLPLVQRQLNVRGAFCSLSVFCSFHCKVVFSVLECFSSPLLRHIQLAKRLEQQHVFFFFCTIIIDR